MHWVNISVIITPLSAPNSAYGVNIIEVSVTCSMDCKWTVMAKVTHSVNQAKMCKFKINV